MSLLERQQVGQQQVLSWQLAHFLLRLLQVRTLPHLKHSSPQAVFSPSAAPARMHPAHGPPLRPCHPGRSLCTGGRQCC
jgi:hypothetical protein